MKEAYVSYEIAKLLKEKGFDVPIGRMYVSPNNEFVWCETFAFFEKYDELVPTCTHQMACSWLREEHEIDIIPVIRHSLKYAQESPFRDYACRVYDCDGNIVLSATKWYSRYENAVEAALEYSLKNLI